MWLANNNNNNNNNTFVALDDDSRARIEAPLICRPISKIVCLIKITVLQHLLQRGSRVWVWNTLQRFCKDKRLSNLRILLPCESFVNVYHAATWCYCLLSQNQTLIDGQFASVKWYGFLFLHVVICLSRKLFWPKTKLI